MLLWVIAAVAYPQLGGRLGKVVDKGIKRADIIQIDFASLDAETGQEYINSIKELVNKKEMLTKSNNPQDLEKRSKAHQPDGPGNGSDQRASQTRQAG